MQDTATAIMAPGDELLGTTLGDRYKIVKRLSQGGMGVVFLGRHAILDNLLAVKVLLRERNEIDQQRFLLEARLASKINHPNTVNIVDFGVLSGGRSYLVMEYLKGDTLDDVLKKGRIDPPRACRIVAQIARGLQAVHDKGIIHRDLKPANIFVLQHDDKPDFIKIVDFGIAKETVPVLAAGAAPTASAAPDQTSSLASPHDLTSATGGMVGTPAYVSPEQAQELPVDARTDQYSLGCMLFEMLTGERPYSDQTRFGLLMKHIKDPVPSVRARCPAAKIPDSVAALVQRLMAKQPAQRFPAMREVAEAFEREGAQLRVPRWGIGALAAAFLLLLVCSGYLGVRLYRDSHQDRPRLRPEELAQRKRESQQILLQDLRGDNAAVRQRAIAALGPLRDGAQRATLEGLLSSGDAAVAGQAAESLGQLGEREAVGPLTRLLAQNGSGSVRLAAAHALVQLGEPQGLAYLDRALGEGAAELRLHAAFLLCDQDHPKAHLLLQQAVERGLLSESLALNVLHCLAQGKEGNSARERLKALLHHAGQSKQKIPVAARLTQLGDEEGRGILRELAKRPGPEQLPAARALAAPEESETAELFRRVLKQGDGHAELGARLLATEGLGLSGELFDVRLLGSQLQNNDPELRQATAIAILQIAANEPSALTTQSLGWARGALAAGDWQFRESAAAVLGDSQSADAVPLLVQLLTDREAQVRRSTVHALGRRIEREALLALRQSLHDPEADVRREALRSIGRIVLSLRERGDTQSGQLVSGWLQELLGSAGKQDSILASQILLQLGDERQRERLRGWQNNADPEVRRFLIEETEQEKEYLVRALKDTTFAVRFAAARKLAEQGDRTALPVLTEAIELGGSAGIAAYGLLNRLGQKVDRPEMIAAALSPATSTSQRLAAIEAIGRMPADLAVPLLLQAAHDRERLVRRLVVEMAADLPLGPQGPPGLPVLRMLLNDADPAVRARAAALHARVAAEAAKPAAAAAKTVAAVVDAATAPVHAVDAGAALPPPDAAVPEAVVDAAVATAEQVPDAGEAPVGRGTLIIAALEGVQFQIDRRGWQGATKKPISLPAGAHRVTSLTGTQEVIIEDKKTVTLTIEESPVEKTLSSGIAAYRSKEYTQAHKYFERATTQCARDREHTQACSNLAIELGLQRGHLFEDEKRWPEAMIEYQKVVKADAQAKGSKSLYRIEAQEAMTRLAPRLGQIIIQHQEGEACKEEVVWLLPGTQTVKVNGKRQTVSVRPGDSLRLGECS